MSEPFIVLENVSYAYESEESKSVPVLHGLSLTVQQGEYLAIL